MAKFLHTTLFENRLNKKTFCTITVFACLGMLLTFGCDKKVGQDIGVPCDQVTFTNNIGPLVKSNCALSGCHAAGTQQIPLLNYTDVKTIADDGRMKSYVIDGNPEFMPKGGQLSTKEKALVVCWIDNGKKE
ncbi:MAG: hypothetical protein H0W61_14440 [Bacteroidetes bacterium]|nr:hypothetical protein [Bacteroidota bacterium]